MKVVLALTLVQDEDCFFTSDFTMESDCRG